LNQTDNDKPIENIFNSRIKLIANLRNSINDGSRSRDSGFFGQRRSQEINSIEKFKHLPKVNHRIQIKPNFAFNNSINFLFSVK